MFQQVRWTTVGAIVVAATALGGFAGTQAEAASEFVVPFEQIRESDGGLTTPDIASQLSVRVFDAGMQDSISRVGFEIWNHGPVDSHIAQIHFDDRLDLLSNPVFTDSTERPGGGPGPDWQISFRDHSGALPRGANLDPAFETTVKDDVRFAWQAESGQEGVEVGEFVTLQFDLAEGYGFDAVRNAMPGPDLRLGLHVRGIADGSPSNSASFTTAPTPGAGVAGLALLGLMGGAGLARRKLRQG